jgi:hypothetical protein
MQKLMLLIVALLCQVTMFASDEEYYERQARSCISDAEYYQRQAASYRNDAQYY